MCVSSGMSVAHLDKWRSESSVGCQSPTSILFETRFHCRLPLPACSPLRPPSCYHRGSSCSSQPLPGFRELTSCVTPNYPHAISPALPSEFLGVSSFKHYKQPSMDRLFFSFSFFETGFLSILEPVLVLTLPKLALNSKRSASLCFPRAGIKSKPCTTTARL